MCCNKKDVTSTLYVYSVWCCQTTKSLTFSIFAMKLNSLLSIAIKYCDFKFNIWQHSK